MVDTSRPSMQELERLAGLIISKDQSHSDKNDVGPVASQQPATEPTLEQLDYHGITLLAAEYGAIPQSLNAKINQRKAMMAAVDDLKSKALIELFEAFENAGLTQCVLFKGAALAHTIYRQPWLRPRTDSDCLIDGSQLTEFSRIFQELGYHKQFALEGDLASYQSTFSKPLSGNSTMNIDLHWRISNRQPLSNTYSVQQLSLEGQQLTHLSPAIIIPTPVDSLLISCLHRLGHHPSEERLVWLYDIHLLAASFSTTMWQELLYKARSKSLCAIASDALLASQQLLGTAIPKAIMQELNEVDDEANQIYLQRDLPEWRFFMHDLKTLRYPSEKLKLLQEHILPSPRYIRERMGTNSAIKGYVLRIIRGVRRFF